MSGEIVSLGGRDSRLSSDRLEIAKRLIATQVRRPKEIRRYPRSTVDGKVCAPASWPQQRLWFIDNLEGHSKPYHMGVGFRLSGQLHPNALQSALDALVLRHEPLRTRFVSFDGELHQEIDTFGRFLLERTDLRSLREADRRVLLSKVQREELGTAFNLAKDFPIRGRLLRLEDDEHILIISIHHIIWDGWSMGIFQRELSALYEASLDGVQDALESLPIQYADYAQWQLESLDSERLARQLFYWRDHLSGVPTQLNLPTDRMRRPTQSYRGRSVEFDLGHELSARLRGRARQYGMSLFMVLFASWSVLLSKLSGQEDIVIGAPVANRRHAVLEGLIGLFANTLPIRVCVRAESQIGELLSNVKRLALDAYDNQEVPFDKLVELIQPERSLGRNPIFQVLLTVQNAPSHQLALRGVNVCTEWPQVEASQFDVTLSFDDRQDNIAAEFVFATDLFDRETVLRWVEYLKVVLTEMTSAVTKRIGEMSILPEAELHRVIEVFNQVRSYPQEKMIQEIFEAQVRLHPEAIAVVCESESLTYSELNARANQLAWHLRAKGVGAEQRVAICIERSIDMVVGLLGILKAGGAYVPLDLAYPSERLALMIEDAAPAIVLIHERSRDKLPAALTKVVALDTDHALINGQATYSPSLRPLGLTSDSLAYVIYTSGSTGKPKGVMVEHRNAVRLFAATEEYFGFNERDVWTLFHSVAFDFSVWEIWGALLHGGQLLIVPYMTTRSPEEFYQLLCEKGVTVLNQTPSAFARLIEAQGRVPALKHALRVVIFGGEALEFRILRPWIERNGLDKPQLVNMYGITETTVHVTYRRLSREEIESDGGSVVGRPIPDLSTYLLNPHSQPVPIGVTGELYVGGAGVARGYLNRPELTAERFVANPFSADPKARMYKTGDLGRWRTDGTIEYLGRNDQQVKIRGFRIELGEIEAQLVRHPQVKEAVVVVREEGEGEKRLVGYVIPKEISNPPSAESLREHLKGMLPEYMVPSAFVQLEALPLTPNGKLDRRALPAPDLSSYSSRQYEPPQGEVEQMLAGIWQELLKVERVGRNDNFFELGGHSLTGVRLIGAIRELMDVSLPVATVFQHSSIQRMAKVVTSLHDHDCAEARNQEQECDEGVIELTRNNPE